MRGLITDLPRTALWDFGGHPYGLEPLTVPADAAAEPAPEIDDELRVKTKALLDAARQGSLPVSEPVERLYWFRWITGHQATFVLWRLLADAMTHAKEPVVRQEALGRASRFVLGYAAMLLYTSSCPQDVYHDVIRPTMAFVHPAFSGTWAPDYVAVGSVLRGRIPGGWEPDSAGLAAASAFSRRVHEGVAEKLVPGSLSLLQNSGGPRRDWRPDVLATLYDSYFLTVRAPVPVNAVVLQLVRRLQAIQIDLATNGLDPVHGVDELPAGLLAGDVRDLVRDLPALLSDLGVDAVAQLTAYAPAVVFHGR